MIRHIVFFTAKDPKDLPAIHQGLLGLGQIKHSSKFEVTLNTKTDPLSDVVDVVVYAEFENEAALDAYRDDPIYRATTKLVKPLRDMRFSADVKAK